MAPSFQQYVCVTGLQSKEPSGLMTRLFSRFSIEHNTPMSSIAWSCAAGIYHLNTYKYATENRY